jgi:hypothetical protein
MHAMEFAAVPGELMPARAGQTGPRTDDGALRSAVRLNDGACAAGCAALPESRFPGDASRRLAAARGRFTPALLMLIVLFRYRERRHHKCQRRGNSNQAQQHAHSSFFLYPQ